MDNAFYNRVSGDRLASRQIDELIGVARGLIADGVLNQQEVEFLQKWLAANLGLSDQPLIRRLYARIAEVLADGALDQEEKAELINTLQSLTNQDSLELGETLRSTTLPLCNPPPNLTFADQRYCFTGTFNYGQRKHCEAAVIDRGGQAGGLTQKTKVLVIGLYATDSWKHSAFGNKILDAAKMRDDGFPISIVSESHWIKFL